jgi:hypothetical protein
MNDNQQVFLLHLSDLYNLNFASQHIFLILFLYQTKQPRLLSFLTLQRHIYGLYLKYNISLKGRIFY